MKIFASTLLAMGVAQAAALESSPNTDEQLAQTTRNGVDYSNSSPMVMLLPLTVAVKKTETAKVAAISDSHKAAVVVKVDTEADIQAKRDAARKIEVAKQAAAVAKAKKDAADAAKAKAAELAKQAAEHKAAAAAKRLADDKKIAEKKAAEARAAVHKAAAAKAALEAKKLEIKKHNDAEKARIAKEKAAKDAHIAKIAHAKVQKAKADKATAAKIKAKQEKEAAARRAAAHARAEAKKAAAKAEAARIAKAKADHLEAVANKVITQFEVFKQKKTWYDARRVCRKWGGKLVSVLTPEEQNKVRKMIKPHVQAYWIGARKTTKGYRWVDGKSLKFKNWGKGQPDGTKRGNSTCVAIVGGSHWMNANCFHKARFICAKRAELKDVNSGARKHERDYLAAHHKELARRAAIVTRLASARKEREHAEDKMRHMAHLKAIAMANLKTAQKAKLAALLKLKNEKKLAHIAQLKLELSIKNRRIADAQARAAIRLSVEAKKRADRNAYLAGIAAGKAKEEHARMLREIEHAKVAHAAAETAEAEAKKAIRERNIEIEHARKAEIAKHAAEKHARDEYKKWQVAVEFSRKQLDIKNHTEKTTHKIMIHQAKLTADAKMHFVRAQVARIAAVKRAVHAHKVWDQMKIVAHHQQIKQTAAEKLAAYWKAKRDAARKSRDIAIAEKNKAHKAMERDHHLFEVSVKAKKAAEDRLAAAELHVVSWKTKVTVAHKHYDHHLKLRLKAKAAFTAMHLSMEKAQTKADKMEALKIRAHSHWKKAVHILKVSVKVYHAGVHAFKKSETHWKTVIDKTEKAQALKQMEHKKAWMKKVHLRWDQAKKTMNGFKINMALWKKKWLAARARMNAMKTKAASAKIFFGKVTIIMNKAHHTLKTTRVHLKKMITRKMTALKLKISAHRNWTLQVKATALKKKFAIKMHGAMKHAIKEFIHHKAQQIKAQLAAKIQKEKTHKAIIKMREDFATMEAWKKSSVRAQKREHLSHERRAKAILAAEAAHARYLAAVKSRRHAFAKKEAAIRSRRSAQLLAGGALKAQNAAEAKAALSVERLARATRMMRVNLKIKLAAEKSLARQAKLRKAAEDKAFHHHRQAIRREKRAKEMYKMRLAAQLRHKLSLVKLMKARAAAKLALKHKLVAEAHAEKSMAKDKLIIHTWHTKVVKATHLRMKAQKAAKIAHHKYLHALKLKTIALKQMKHAHETSIKAHALMVHHRRVARKARRAMRLAHVAMKKAIVHRDEMKAYFLKMEGEHKLAHIRLMKAKHEKKMAIKAYGLSVIARKDAEDKRNHAIERRIKLVKQAKHWVVKADKAHHAQKAMFVKMTHAKETMMKVKVELSVQIKALKHAATEAAKKRAHVKVTMLKTQLNHRTVTFNLYVVKEKNMKAIWMKLRHANEHAVKMIAAMTKKVHHWRGVYKVQDAKRHVARTLQAKFIKATKKAVHIMNHAIKIRKHSVERHAAADAAHLKAVAFKKLQVSLRIKAEKMTAIYKHKYTVAIEFGSEQKKLAAKYHTMAHDQKALKIKFDAVYKNQAGIMHHAKLMHAKFVKRVIHFKAVARGLKVKTIHYRAVAVRLEKEKRRLDMKAADHNRRTVRALAATKVEKKKIAVYLVLAKKNQVKRVYFEMQAHKAFLALQVAKKEHKRQVMLKRSMLAHYAKLTARNLRVATEKVTREKRITKKAKQMTRHFINKRTHSLKHTAIETAKTFTIRKTHTTRRAHAKKIADRVIRHHEKKRAVAIVARNLHIKNTVKANKRAHLAIHRRTRIIIAAKKAAALNAKLICNIRLSASMKRHMFDSEMCQRSKNFLNKLTDEKAPAKRLVSERQVVKFWCTARNARRAQVAANKKCKSGGKFKTIALHNESMANVATVAAWGSPAQKHIPKNGKGHISYKKWYAKVMKLAAAMQKTPCPVMPGAPAKSLIVHTRHHKSVKLVGGNTMVLTHTNYYYTKPCTQKCKVVKRTVSLKKTVK